MTGARIRRSIRDLTALGFTVLKGNPYARLLEIESRLAEIASESTDPMLALEARRLMDEQDRILNRTVGMTARPLEGGPQYDRFDPDLDS